MSRFIITLLMTVFILCVGVHAWSQSPLSSEMAEFLKHRNVLLSLDFEVNSNLLTRDSKKSLDRVASDLKVLLGSNKIVRIEGYAAPPGSEDYNLVLSMRRAMAVQNYLQSHYGVELDLYFNGYGASQAPAEKLVQLAFYDDTLGLALAEVDAVVTQ